MGITIGDIKRAILGGGDVSTLISALHRALGDAPLLNISSLEVPIVLPEATTLLRYIDNDLTSLLKGWLTGRDYDGARVPEVDLTVVGLAPYGRNVSSYLESIMDEIEPDIVAIDTSPVGLSANMLYAFSMPCAVGLPGYGEVLPKDDGQLHAVETFYPGSINQTAIVKCWLAKIPLMPVGMPSVPGYAPARTADETYLDREMLKSNLLAVYHAFDESLEKMPHLQEGKEITQQICQICSNLSNTIDSGIREELIEEASYIASRIMEVASFACSLGRKAKLLAIVDVKHYVNIQYVISLLTKGITDEVYLPPRPDVPATDMVMVSKHSAKLTEYAQEHAPKTTLAQELFRNELEKLSQAKDSEQLAEGEVDDLIAAIASRTRGHPDIARGASVRGAIAFKEVLQGFKEMQNGVTRSSIEKAALITLPPRISTKPGADESAVAIISNIVQEVLYGIQFSRAEDEMAFPEKIDWLSPEEIMKALQNLEQIAQEQNPDLAQKGQIAIIPDGGFPQEGEENQYPSIKKTMEDLMEELEQKLKRGEITEDEYHREKDRLEEMLRATFKKAIGQLMEELEQKLKRGEITEDEYHREKDRLDELLKTTSQPRYQMSGQELAETVMELMDGQDKQWEKEVSFKQMYIYYHMKSTREGKQLSPPKRGYYGLRVLINDLEKRGILRAATPGKSSTLTAEALNTLLEHLIPKARRGRELKGVIDSGKAQASERKHDVRRYSFGDVFRDISVRHTLREVARQKKKLSDINRRDFRVFIMEQRQRLQSDIVLCVDTSGSMGFRHKLTYARLAAAGLVRAAVENGDRVGIIAFDDLGRTIMPLSDWKKELVDYIARINAGGNTNIGDGIQCATQLLLHQPSRNQKHIVLITDGQPTAVSETALDQFKPTKERDLTEEYAILEIEKAASSGVKVSVIHIANSKEDDEEFVKNIANAGKGQLIRVSCPEDLRAIM